ncbi:MAG: sorbosone dehydrogenase family protein [Candidatus Hydrogenedentes bacterium]|nr:sorbosone dehydrogenase family protein [Candidatus Hydrogenedentota bacterium]
MTLMKRTIAAAVLAVFGACTSALAQSEIRLGTIKLPDGFRISTFAPKVPNARSLTLGGDGIVYVSSRDRGAGQVYAVVDKDKNGEAEEVHVIAKGLTNPNGVAYRDGALYVAAVNQILRFDNIDTTYMNSPTPVLVTDKYPSDATHGWRYIAFGPDGKLYVPVGSPVNVGEPPTDHHACITTINADGTGMEVFAKGVRNTVGFDWHPKTKELWFTENGRDLLGPDSPPDELNRVQKAGMHFGFPYFFGKDTPDPKFGEGKKASDYTGAAQDLAPHAAALGMRFYTGSMFPEKYRNQIFIAEHGSAERKPPVEPTGYCISLATLDADSKVTKYETFAKGWMQTGSAWGRPVDVLVMPDGALLVTDDTANCIYRITYSK